ncbi:hypothetical protein SAMN05421542_0939 [Chryseobacterium jejuense]|uniref:Uncharacterized protein n=1 Tax=Chryseobacterium jejuense TaxID=445960 RepID=A0A2X2XM26_CHRJE|nr:hypothetical protein SAMN05421542_0939 [Chryseobacterium jejuense]SQB26799.1 Uncharacterised protein [Chryseobacterium jejuense]
MIILKDKQHKIIYKPVKSARSERTIQLADYPDDADFVFLL